MTLEELLKLQEELADDSKQIRDVFNETLHSTFSSAPIRRLSIQAQISKKVFVPLVMQMPFHPLTGKTDVYTGAKKWVTARTPEDIMSAIKHRCESDPELKSFYLRMSDWDHAWDTSDPSVVDTAADKAVLWIYRRQMAYHHIVTSINSPQITGSEYSQKYLLDTQQDPLTGAFTGTLSFMHRLASLTGSLAKREIDSYKEALEKNNPNNLCKLMGRDFTQDNKYLSLAKESEESKDRVRGIRRYYPISSPYPSITYPLLAFDLTPRSGMLFEHDEAKDSYELLDVYKNHSDIRVEEFLYYNGSKSLNDEIDNIIGNYFPRNPTKHKERNRDKDLYVNFVVLDYVLNDTRAELTKEEKFELSKRLVFAQEGNPMYDTIKKTWQDPALPGFLAKLKDFFVMASDKDFVRTINGWIASTYNELTPVIEEASVNYYHGFLHPTLPVYDKTLQMKYSETLQDIFPTEQASFLLENQTEFGEKQEGLFQELMQEGVSSEDSNPDNNDEDEIVDFAIIK